jgi:peroxiredoxin
MRELSLKTGDRAPDFTLKDQDGKEITLSSLAGKKVLLSFHPLAFTPVCEVQMRSLEIKHGELEKLNTVALGLSVDSQFAKKAWAEQMNITSTRMVADFWPHGDVAKKYGLFIDQLGFSGRANIIVNEKGNISWTRVYELGEIPDIEEVIRHLA